MAQAGSTSTKRRWSPRLQFSLRLLLAAFTAFAIGFPIWYGWPYTEQELRYPTKRDSTGQWMQDKTKPPLLRIDRTFRRTWGGGKVQEGPECVYLPLDGTLLSVTHYQENEKHGKHVEYQRYADPFAPGGVVTVLGLTGAYEHGKKEGRWDEKQTDQDGVGNRAMRTWRADILDGPAEISYRGGLTKRMTFVQGRLVELNGRPIEDLLKRVDDPRIAAELSKQVHLAFVECPLRDVAEYLQDAHNIPIVLDRQVPNVDVPFTDDLTGLDLQSGLIVLLCDCELAIDYRHGCVWVTPTQDAVNWRDSTGAAGIQPPFGSALALAWNEPRDLKYYKTPLKAALDALANSLAIEIDTSQLDPVGHLLTVNVKGLPLRHALGVVLDRTGCRCKLENGKLFILPPEAP